MKKCILIITLLSIVSWSATGRQVIGSVSAADNWLVGAGWGVAAPLKGHSFWQNARGVFGLELRKQMTPAVGLGIDTRWGFNTSSWSGLKSANIIDSQYLGAFASLNMTNLIRGYVPSGRCFELETVAGVGWLHGYWPRNAGGDANSWATKLGLNLNFSLGHSKALTLSLKPAVAWNMNGSAKPGTLGSQPVFNARNVAFELLAGITYRFRNPDGSRNFHTVEIVSQDEIEALNLRINELRRQLAESDSDRAGLKQKLYELEAKADELEKRQSDVKTVYIDCGSVHYVFFRQGTASIDPLQLPEIELLAGQLRDRGKTMLTIRGYSSPEGNLSFNRQLSQTRADSVKSILVSRYGISPDRIRAVGDGIGAHFDIPSWNRVAVCTIDD